MSCVVEPTLLEDGHAEAQRGAGFDTGFDTGSALARPGLKTPCAR
jgi:hypothetical protein